MAVKYVLVPMDCEVSDKFKLVDDGGDRFGNFNIFDLADHQVRINNQILAIENDDNYPNAEKEILDLAKQKEEEKEIAETVIDQFSFDINFDELVEQIGE